MNYNRRSARAIAIARADEVQAKRYIALYALALGLSAVACVLALPFLQSL